jgi:hypothetical protein
MNVSMQCIGAVNPNQRTYPQSGVVGAVLLRVARLATLLLLGDLLLGLLRSGDLGRRAFCYDLIDDSCVVVQP